MRHCPGSAPLQTAFLSPPLHYTKNRANSGRANRLKRFPAQKVPKKIKDFEPKAIRTMR
jgi:hypothetical protein